MKKLKFHVGNVIVFLKFGGGGGYGYGEGISYGCGKYDEWGIGDGWGDGDGKSDSHNSGAPYGYYKTKDRQLVGNEET